MIAKKTPYMRTFTGILYNPLKPNLLHIEIEDIAHGLAGEGRYANQSRIKVPVAAHALAITDVMQALEFDAVTLYSALNHDDAEWCLLDFTAPMKHQPGSAGYRRLEHINMAAISRRFGFLYPAPPAVKVWDTWCRRVEQGLWMRGHQMPERILDGKGDQIFIGGKTAVCRLEDSLTEYVGMDFGKLKSAFIERFYDLRTAACFSPEIDKEGFVAK
jgi:hypothetical protein